VGKWLYSLKDVKATYTASWKLQNNEFWNQDLDFESRVVDVNLTDASGQVKEFPLSGKEIIDAGNRFSYMVSEAIETVLWNHEAIWDKNGISLSDCRFCA
jgi:hypothetical protein